MKKLCANASLAGIPADAQLCAESFGRRAFDAVMQSVQGLIVLRERTASKELNYTTGKSLRACQAWLDGTREGSAGALINILLSGDGEAALVAIRETAEAEGRPVPEYLQNIETLNAVIRAMRFQHEMKPVRARNAALRAKQKLHGKRRK